MPDYPLSNNNRVYYATHAVGIGEIGSDPTTTNLDAANTGVVLPASGLQSVGVNTTFNLEQVFQLGQLEIYENIENLPDVEVTMEKVLDGHTLVQHLATPQAQASTLASRYNNNRTDVHIGFFSDTFENASGINQAELYCSGMYVSSLSLTLPTDGNATESVTLVGNDKVWSTGTDIQSSTTGTYWYSQRAADLFTSDGTPLSTGPGVLRRQDVDMSGSIFPNDIPGLTSYGASNTGNVYQGGGGNGAADTKLFVPTKGTSTAPLFSAAQLTRAGCNASGSSAANAGNVHPVHMSSITISTDLGRTDLFELGKRGPYHRFADFPTEVTCAIEVIEREFGDYVNASADAESNVSDAPIFIMLGDGTLISLGAKNKLASISSTGGDTGGGNRTTTYNFSNFNAYQVHHPLDPAVSRGNITYGNLG